MMHVVRSVLFGATTAAAVVLAATTVACGPGNNVAAAVANGPTMADAGWSRCSVEHSVPTPLLVEWPSSDRAALESRVNRGVVAVRYMGCDLEMITTCTGRGSYIYGGLTPKKETLRIASTDELYARRPVGAARLEAKLETYGELTVDMTIVGRKESDRYDFDRGELEGRCEEATHLITGLTIGAFTMATGAGAEVGASAVVRGVGAGATSTHERAVINSDGDAGACDNADPLADAPPIGCGAVLRVELVPIAGQR